MSSMADNKFDLDRGVGDLETIFHNQGVSDYSWLAITEEDYRASETLPRQNLDIIPELQKALYEDKDDVPRLIPIKPHVIVNQNPLNSTQLVPKDPISPIRNRVSKYLMSNRSLDEIKQLISLEFPIQDVRLAASDITSLINERGLIGNVYLDVSAHPRCASDVKEQSFLRSNGRRALYILAKDSCGDCIHNKNGLCSVLANKQIVDEIPYGTKLAAHYAPQLASEFRPLNFEIKGWKSRLKTSFLQSPIEKSDGIKTAMTQHKAVPQNITTQDLENFVGRVAISNNISFSYSKFAVRMMSGHDDRKFLIASGDKELLSLASEYGLLGHSWIDMDAMGGCKPTLDFIRKRASSGLSEIHPDLILRRSSCQFCKNSSGGCCSEISNISSIVSELPPYDRRLFAKSILRSVRKNVISKDDAKLAIIRSAGLTNPDWRTLTSSINLKTREKPPVPIYSGQKNASYSGVSTSIERIIDPNQVRNFISREMNSGLSGIELRASILKNWTQKDLSSVPQVASIAPYDGIQGKYFIDPTAYNDYGSGCNEGSIQLRKKDVPLVLASSKCTGCTLQTSPGWCSRYAKGLLRSIPNSVMESMKVTRSSSKNHVASSIKSADPASDFDLDKPEMDISEPNSREEFFISVSSPNIDI